MNEIDNKYRILIVEDDMACVRFLKEILPDEFIVDSVYSGIEALSKVEQKHFDLILLGIILPDMSGLEVCRKIKKEWNKKTIKIIIQTAQAYETDRDKGFSVGADDYITKPYDHEILLSKIDDFRKERLKYQLN